MTQNKTKNETVEDMRLRYQIHDIIVRGLIGKGELSSKGLEELLDFIRQLLQSQRLEIAEEVKKIGRGSDGYTLWALDKVLKLLTK